MKSRSWGRKTKCSSFTGYSPDRTPGSRSERVAGSARVGVEGSPTKSFVWSGGIPGRGLGSECQSSVVGPLSSKVGPFPDPGPSKFFLLTSGGPFVLSLLLLPATRTNNLGDRAGAPEVGPYLWSSPRRGPSGFLQPPGGPVSGRGLGSHDPGSERRLRVFDGCIGARRALTPPPGGS